MGFNFLVSVIVIVFLAWNSTSHKSAQSEIVFRSLFSSLAARSGRSKMMYRLVSSAKRRMEQSIFLTISFMYTKNTSGPNMEPWGTLASTEARSEHLPLMTTRCLRPDK